MKRKSITAIGVLASAAVMMFALTACVDGKDEEPQSADGASRQSGGGVNIPDIPPGAVREYQGEGAQTFEIDMNDSGSFSHSFSIDEGDVNGSHSVSIDEGGNIINDGGDE